MDCNNCQYDHGCCSTDSWTVILTPAEALRLYHIRMPDGQYLIASNSNGRCYYQVDDGMCSIYNDRPQVCRDFDCNKRENNVKEVIDRARIIKESAQCSHSGFCFGFIYKTDRTKVVSDVIIKDPDSKKELVLKPAQLFGNSEQDVKQKMIELLSGDFKKEDI